MADSILFSDERIAQAMAHPEFTNFVVLAFTSLKNESSDERLRDAVLEAIEGLADADPAELLLDTDEVLELAKGDAS